jgi:hypothetical protein
MRPAWNTEHCAGAERPRPALPRLYFGTASHRFHLDPDEVLKCL